ncbi:hypothetical protein N7488_012062 [Penicillium malachiteum]|nr:hypothetical protein N7488_012062 [Penicillium malachiteum]
MDRLPANRSPLDTVLVQVLRFYPYARDGVVFSWVWMSPYIDPWNFTSKFLKSRSPDVTLFGCI